MKNKLIKLQANYAAPSRVDGDVIRGVSICTAGEALGHGVHLDESFIQEAFEQSSSLKLGLKARFGHPSMCNEALGTTVGRFKNFSISKDGRQFYGDLHFGEYADEKFKKHILGLAKEDPEAFGTSIVFGIGGYYRKDADGNDVNVFFARDDYSEEYEDYYGSPDDLSEELYVRCGQMYGCDFVDEPAANPGGLFNNGSPAAEIHEIFEQHPEVKRLLMSNKNVVDIIESYGVKIKQFLAKEKTMTEPQEVESEVFESNSDISNENCLESEQEHVEEVEPVEDAVAEDAEESEPDEVVEAMSASEFRALVQEFGAEIATTVFDSNGTRTDALVLRIAELESKLEAAHAEKECLMGKFSALQEKHDELSFDGAAFDPPKKKKRDIAKSVQF